MKAVDNSVAQCLDIHHTVCISNNKYMSNKMDNQNHVTGNEQLENEEQAINEPNEWALFVTGKNGERFGVHVNGNFALNGVVIGTSKDIANTIIDSIPKITQEEDEQLTLEKRLEESDSREDDLKEGWTPEL